MTQGTPSAGTQPGLSTDYKVKTWYVPGISRDYGERNPLLGNLRIKGTDTGGSGAITWHDAVDVNQPMTLSAAITATTTSTTFVVTKLFCAVGDLIRCVSPKNGTEYVFCTAITTSSRTLTVTREQNGTTKLALSTTSTLRVVDNRSTESSTYGKNATAKLTQISNYFTRTFNSAAVSKSAASATNWAGVNAADEELLKQLDDHMDKMEMGLYESKTKSTMSTSVYGHAMGCLGLITTNQNQITSSTIGGTTTSTALTWTKFNTWAQRMKSNRGSNVIKLYFGPTAYQSFQDAAGAHVTEMVATGTEGLVGEHYNGCITQWGQRCRLILVPNMVTGDILWEDVGMGDDSGIFYVPNNKRFLELSDIPNTADVTGKYINTEWSVMVRREWLQGILRGIKTGS